jgi:hypothetical protein
MGKLERSACQICYKENNKGLNYQGYRNKYDVKRIFYDDLTLE